MNNIIGPEWLDKLKQKCDIVSVIGSYIPLTKKGKNYWACCPFHSEKTPSFAVNEWDQYYHCFSCSESGDVISFVSKYEGVDFMTAVKILAAKANMEIPTEAFDENVVKEKKEKDTILKILDETKKYYVANLYKKTSTVPQSYIKKRKITYELLKKFEIGYSENWTGLIEHLKKLGFKIQDMLKAGVIAEKNGRYYDVMAERLMFPIKNSYGETIAFSGRALNTDAYAKYKNTTNTLVFDKSKAIYGINFIKENRNQINYCIIVEGQIDVITMHKFGFTTAIACQGTALTEKHIKEITRFTDNIILCLDGDNAGVKATIKAGELFRSLGYNVKAIYLKNNMDPDEFFKNYTKEDMQELIDNAVSFIEYYIDRLYGKYDLKNLSEKTEFIKKCLSIINSIKFSSEKEIYLKKVSNLTNIPMAILKRDLDNTVVIEPKGEIVENEKPNDVDFERIKLILSCMFNKKEFAKPVSYLDNYLDTISLKTFYEKVVKSYKENEPFTKSSVCSNFDLENDKQIAEIINLDLDKIENLEKYYNECLFSIYSKELLKSQKILKQEFNVANTIERRSEIAKQLSIITKKLAKKTLEED